MLLLFGPNPGEPLGEQIRRHLRTKGLSQQELARLIGTTEPWLSRIVKGRRPPSLALLQKIAAVLELHPLEEALLWTAWKEAKQKSREPRPEGSEAEAEGE